MRTNRERYKASRQLLSLSSIIWGKRQDLTLYVLFGAKGKT
ncbi:MAG: hypothetical protein OQL16_03180 [Gammaproteobacteria bacterium]|nr:hypothetical protein [Gammaproteobacteria bacterium]